MVYNFVLYCILWRAFKNKLFRIPTIDLWIYILFFVLDNFSKTLGYLLCGILNCLNCICYSNDIPLVSRFWGSFSCFSVQMIKCAGNVTTNFGQQVQLLIILSSNSSYCLNLVRRWEYLKEYFIKLFILSAVLHLYLLIFYSAEVVLVT